MGMSCYEPDTLSTGLRMFHPCSVYYRELTTSSCSPNGNHLSLTLLMEVHDMLGVGCGERIRSHQERKEKEKI